MPDPSDEQLVRGFQGGDDAAFDLFVLRHQGRLYRVSLMWLDDATLAQDAVQECLYRTYSGISRFRFKARPTTWLMKILKNVCFEMNRKRAFVPLEEDMLEQVADEHDPTRTIGELHGAISDLPERQRQAVTLRILEAFSTRDTARIMGCREGTVKAHLNKAMNGLRNRLDVDDWV